MRPRNRHFAVTLILLIFVFLGVVSIARAAAISPKQQIKETADRTLAILNDATLSEEAKKELLKKTILPHMDFNEIAKRTLVRHFKANESRMDEFVPLLKEFLENAYANMVVVESSKNVVIQVLGESTNADDANYATVRTKIITTKGKEILVDYRLRFNGNEWMVFDIAIEGVSMVSNYREQFGRIIQKSSFDGLLQALRNKIQELKNK